MWIITINNNNNNNNNNNKYAVLKSKHNELITDLTYM